MDLIDAVRSSSPYLESWLEFQRDRTRLPGLQAAVRVNGELVFSCALGLSNVETGERLTVDHLFRIASHSKTFTATAVFQLVEAGRLRLDDAAGSWLPELAGAPAADYTVRELLGHQSGINRDSDDSDYWALDHDFPDRAGVVAMARQDAVYAPNEHFKYSNVGYSLLGMIVEAASGQPYADYVTEHIVGALGLENCGPEVPEERVGDLAGAHTGRLFGEDTPRVIPSLSSGAMASATGFYATAEDATAYLSAHAYGREELISDASKRLMQRRESRITKGGERFYGLGLIMAEVGDRLLVGHSGGWPGHITQSWLDPASGLCVSVLTNQLGGAASEFALNLVRLIDLAANPPADREPDADGVDKEPFTGRYAAMWGSSDIALLGDRLVELSPAVTDPRVTATELRVVDETTLAPAPEAGFGAVGEPLRFERDDQGRVTSARFGGGTVWPIEEYLRRRDEGESGGGAVATPVLPGA